AERQWAHAGGHVRPPRVVRVGGEAEQRGQPLPGARMLALVVVQDFQHLCGLEPSMLRRCPTLPAETDFQCGRSLQIPIPVRVLPPTRPPRPPRGHPGGSRQLPRRLPGGPRCGGRDEPHTTTDGRTATPNPPDTARSARATTAE